MLRISRVISAGIVTGVVLLGTAGKAAAQATTTSTVKTTTSSTTSTTLLPHPFSAATASCIRQAKDAFRSCRRAGNGDSCSTQYQTDFANCFATGGGVSCATKCVSKEQTCLGAAPTTKKTCRKTCATNKRADVRACRRMAEGDTIWAGGDAGCLTTAQANLDLCHFNCSEAELACRVALKFCIANCPNL